MLQQVLLLEAGGQDVHPMIHVPAGYLYTMVSCDTAVEHFRYTFILRCM